ncbi:MAG: FAD-dependent oxidoreductase [Lachnospiraceae bacterium]|jgi:ribulose 1,5-bisphosphate synthetase/thiazole synthase|nr:FAD-dependent oxidoreductase [Lachnospiraceae bacterium]
MSIHKTDASYDVIVVGGGLSGVCAAVASARAGAKTAIVQNRSMFGGNASSEVRMHVAGANCHSSKPNLRETGILEEILLENKRRNPYASFPVFDTIIWEKVYMEENLTSYLNTNMDEAIVENGRIQKIICHQNSTETEINLSGKIFIDATGHGTLGVMAGAASRTGSESRAEFQEPTAPEEANQYTNGNTIMFIAADRGEPVKFIRPVWANQYSEEDLKYRPHDTGTSVIATGGEIVKDGQGGGLPEFSAVDSGYWWIELGGDDEDIVKNGEAIRDQLLKCVYGVWDHLKNVGDHGIENYDLEWVGMVPGYRESRRLEGDYILTEHDIRGNRIFEDAVAYGGWPMDNHVPGGLKELDKYPSKVYNFDGCYTIPYRCYYSRNVSNLMMAGRDISTSKMAFSSIRIMGSCAVGGQAAGTAAAMAVEYDCSPRQIGELHIKELQQKLLKEDCYIPGFSNEDEGDLARTAAVSASSQTENGPAENVINGVSRTVGEASNFWESKTLKEGGETLTLKLLKPEKVNQVRLTFDTDLSHEIMPSISKVVRERQVKTLPIELVKDYDVTLLKDGNLTAQIQIRDNGQRLNRLDFSGAEADEVRITVFGTYGLERARIYEVRIY